MTKVALFHVEIELASVTTPPLALPDLVSFAGDVTRGTFTSTTIMELLRRIQEDAPRPYLLVDIGDGSRWLASRLFLFSFVLWRIGAIRAVVFVETRGEYVQRLLGVALPDRVCAVLEKKYTWFRDALEQSSKEATPWFAPHLPLPRPEAQELAERFPKKIQSSPDEPASSDGWELLPSSQPPTWEHTKWLDRKAFDDDLRPACFDRDESQLVDSPDTPASWRNRALLRRRAPYIAVVNSSRELKCLVERDAFLERVAEHVANELEASDHHASSPPRERHARS
jgi:hypothetical protein